MHGNRISKVDRNVFSKLMRLRKLDLGDNYIEVIDDDSFIQLGELTSLNMQSNNINSLNMQTFAGLRGVSILKRKFNVFQFSIS